MPKNLKALLAKKLAENSQRHADAQQETDFDVGRYHVKLSVDEIDPNPYQPRRLFPQQELEELAASISEVGLFMIAIRSLRANVDGEPTSCLGALLSKRWLFLLKSPIWLCLR